MPIWAAGTQPSKAETALSARFLSAASSLYSCILPTWKPHISWRCDNGRTRATEYLPKAGENQETGRGYPEEQAGLRLYICVRGGNPGQDYRVHGQVPPVSGSRNRRRHDKGRALSLQEDQDHQGRRNLRGERQRGAGQRRHDLDVGQQRQPGGEGRGWLDAGRPAVRRLPGFWVWSDIL